MPILQAAIEQGTRVSTRSAILDLSGSVLVGYPMNVHESMVCRYAIALQGLRSLNIYTKKHESVLPINHDNDKYIKRLISRYFCGLKKCCLYFVPQMR